MKRRRGSVSALGSALLLLVWALCLCQTLFAEEAKPKAEPTTEDSSLEATVETPAPSKFSLSYFAVYSGPPVANPFVNGSINTNTGVYDPTASQNLYNSVRLDYFFDTDAYIGAMANFQWVPVGQMRFVGQDSGIRIGHRKIVHTDQFNWAADLRLWGPLKPSTKVGGEVFQVQTLQNLTYDIPKTAFTIGLLQVHSYLQYDDTAIRDPKNPKAQDDATLYFAPNIAYKILPNLSATLWLEIYPHHVNGADVFNWAIYPTDIAPGISWDITPDVSLSPQVLIYPGQDFINSLSSLIYFSAKFI